MSTSWWDGVLVGMVVGSAIAVVTVRHEVRERIQQLEMEKASTVRIEAQWRSLEVSRAAAEQPEALKRVAAQMGLSAPTPDRMRRWEELR
jgi:cell division protein FtsL